MRKLSYFILGLILLFVIIFAVTPVLIGSTVHSYVDNTAQNIQQKHPDSSIKITKYDRHWFSSDASFKVTYRLPFILSGMSRGKPVTLAFNAHIKHGPLISYTSDGKRFHELAKSATVLTSPDMQGTITIVTSWRHDIKVLFDVENFNSNMNQVQLTAKNIEGYVNYLSSSKSINYDLSIGSLSKTFEPLPNVKDKSVSINSKLKGSLTKDENFWAGNLTASRDDVTVTRNGTPMMEIKNIVTAYSSQVTDGRANLRAQVKAANVTFAGQKYGALSYAASVTNADIKSLNQLIGAFKKFYLSDNISFSNVISIYSPLLTLAEKGITVNIQNFTLDLPDSDPIQLTATLQFVEAPQDINFLNFFKYMSANGHIALPREFVLQQLTEFYQDILSKQNDTEHSASAKAEQTLNEWIANKMLTEKSNGLLESNFNVKDGRLLVNGLSPDFKLNGLNIPKVSMPVQNMSKTKPKTTQKTTPQ
jgi:uncharacterized protein YdgA (DUF945 family)